MEAPPQPEGRAPEPAAKRLRDLCADAHRSGCASAGLLTEPESWMRQYERLLSRTGQQESWMAVLRGRVEGGRIVDPENRTVADVETLVGMARKAPAPAKLLVLDFEEEQRGKSTGTGEVVEIQRFEDGLIVMEHRGQEPKLLKLFSDALTSGMAGMRGNPEVRVPEILDYLRATGGLTLRDSGASHLGTLEEDFVLTKNPRYWRFPVLHLELLGIPAGRFLMGSPEHESGRKSDERQHWVRLTRAFWMGKFPVTQGQYGELMGTNPSQFTGDERLPVENVLSDDAHEFCKRLNAASEGRRPEGLLFRLPTEAEWEFCCRAGTEGPFGVGDGSSLSSREANFDGRNPYGGAEKGPNLEKTTRVGDYPGNRWGLHDMHGNVWEWCQDWYGEFAEDEVEDPVGPPEGPERVVRGGSWSSHANECRSAYHFGDGPGYRWGIVGFRVCLVPGPAKPASE